VHDDAMTTLGTVRDWRAEEGWGVIDSPETPGGCWTHFSHVLVAGYVALQAGQIVNLDWESARQDGYKYRTTRTWPVDTEPVVATVKHSGPTGPDSSRLTVVFDEDQT
jgi:CspA family cold shock protein